MQRLKWISYVDFNMVVLKFLQLERERERGVWPGLLDGSYNLHLRDAASPSLPCREGARQMNTQSLLPPSLPPIPVGVPIGWTPWEATGQGACGYKVKKDRE